MTPFDTVALVAMLWAFYPAVSVANLQRARQERPEYFASGVLFGTQGEKLRLPDGRVFDLILNADGLPHERRWQAIEPGPSTGDDPFALDPGPLTPIDGDAFERPPFEGGFAALVADALGDVATADAVLGTSETDLAQAGADTELADLDGDDVATVAQTISDDRATFNELDLTDVITRTGGEALRVESALGEIGDPEGNIPAEEPLPDPGPPREDHERDPRDPRA